MALFPLRVWEWSSDSQRRLIYDKLFGNKMELSEMREHTYTHSQMYKTHQTIISGNGEGWLPIGLPADRNRQVHIPTGILNPLSTEEAAGCGLHQASPSPRDLPSPVSNR